MGAEFRFQVFDVLLGLDTGVPQRVERYAYLANEGGMIAQKYVSGIKVL